ncbi:hypothetical protein [Streptomyces alkaliterrae]|uniref:hypothetical protein n=1 Tax=Streptomyces alkaliterrae TaxID=2213162 RepID=UPI001E3A1DD0|nr:hypothetical protein [Streptomyces alkaliterrae]
MAFGILGSGPTPIRDSPSRLTRVLEPEEWTAADVPLLRSPREVVAGLLELHTPSPRTAVLGVLDAEERIVAGASFEHTGRLDGWELRNALLVRLRRVIPHDLRRRRPTRTGVLLYCRDGDGRWTEEDGAWMWGLRDACALHGLRCGAYISLTPAGWRVVGDDRRGRSPLLTVESPGLALEPTAAPRLAGSADTSGAASSPQSARAARSVRAPRNPRAARTVAAAAAGSAATAENFLARPIAG